MRLIPGLMLAALLLAGTAGPAPADTYDGEPSMGYAVFSAEPSAEGCKPCSSPCPSIVATVRTTWSGIKTLFR